MHVQNHCCGCRITCAAPDVLSLYAVAAQSSDHEISKVVLAALSHDADTTIQTAQIDGNVRGAASRTQQEAIGNF